MSPTAGTSERRRCPTPMVDRIFGVAAPRAPRVRARARRKTVMSNRLLIASSCLGLLTSRLLGAEPQKLTGPYTQDNLTIYLVHGPDTVHGEYLTLEEGLAAKKVIVNETGNVNELTIENQSDMPVYVQSGDIVKGGRQDRTIGVDIVLAPHSKKIPIASFCVEHGRWTQRGSEPAALFSSSDAT